PDASRMRSPLCADANTLANVDVVAVLSVAHAPVGRTSMHSEEAAQSDTSHPAPLQTLSHIPLFLSGAHKRPSAIDRSRRRAQLVAYLNDPAPTSWEAVLQ